MRWGTDFQMAGKDNKDIFEQRLERLRQEANGLRQPPRKSGPSDKPTQTDRDSARKWVLGGLGAVALIGGLWAAAPYLGRIGPELAGTGERLISALVARTPKPGDDDGLVAATAEGRMGQIDVVVTDRSAPVYLVLQSFNRDILWNIHLGPEVTLAHIAMIGNKSGFAAPKGPHSYEALRIEDFIDTDSFFENDKPRPCMILPGRAPQPDWKLLQLAADPNNVSVSTYKGQLDTITLLHGAFANWYRDTLGVDPNLNLTESVSAANALVGPQPAQPIAMQPISQRQLFLTQSDFVAFGKDQMLAHHDTLLSAAAGGDPDRIKPPIVGERITNLPLSKDQVVYLDYTLPFERLLQAGETPPDPALRGAYAAARTPALLTQNCDILLETIADSCQAANPRGSSSEGGARIKGYLRFTTKGATKRPLKWNGPGVESLRLDLQTASTLPFSRQSQRIALSFVLPLCERLRSQTGSCDIYQAELAPSPYDKVGGEPGLSARVTFLYEADANTPPPETLKAILSQSLAALKAQGG